MNKDFVYSCLSGNGSSSHSHGKFYLRQRTGKQTDRQTETDRQTDRDRQIERVSERVID